MPVAPEKTVGPAQIITFLGLSINMLNKTVGVPENKVKKALSLIANMKSSWTITVQKAQALTGHLNFICKALPGARCFNRRLYDLQVIKGNPKPPPYFHIKVTPEAKLDLQVWEDLLQNRNFTIALSFLNQSCTVDSEIYTDASEVGWGVSKRGEWAWGAWNLGALRTGEISLGEMFVVLVTLDLFVERYQWMHVIFHIDNLNVYSWVNNQTAKAVQAMPMIRKLVKILMENNIRVTAQYIRSEDNIFMLTVSLIYRSKNSETAIWRPRRQQ